jgi:hypothetical protein
MSRQITTILDLTDRDEQDDILFPIDAQSTIFTRKIQPTINFVSANTEHTHRGPAEFGQRFVFDLGRAHGDFLSSLTLQIKLGHWLTEDLIRYIQSPEAQSQDWFYANSLGTAIIAKAEIEMDGVIIETLDSDYLNIRTLLDTTINDFGRYYDQLGRVPPQQLAAWQSAAPAKTRFFPTETRIIECPLLFHFTSQDKKSMLPLIATRENFIKVHITLRPFQECVRSITGWRESCDATPTSTSTAPLFEDIRLLVGGVFYDNQVREDYMRSPIEYLFRQPNSFRFDQPLKYVVTKSAGNTANIQLPLEINNPIQEIYWIFRRKSAAINNEWTNYSLLSEQQRTHISQDKLTAIPPPINKATIHINGYELISAPGDWFRQHLAHAHPGGSLAYKSFIYGYTFALDPTAHQPSGSFNASRTSSVKLSLEVNTPPPLTAPAGSTWTDETLKGWEIGVYVVGLNWIRFQNGMANLLFSK